MTTETQIAAMLNWQREHAGQLKYSQTADTRLASDAARMTTATDCSGLIARLYKHFAGIDVGTYTGNEQNYGKLVTTKKSVAAAGKGMLPGDVILFNWSGHNPTWDHIAMYAGNGRIWNHGGPGRGPLNWSLRDNVNSATEVMVRRYLPPTPAKPAAPAKPFNIESPFPYWTKPGHVIGSIDGDDKHHGGINATEKSQVRAVVGVLGILGYKLPRGLDTYTRELEEVVYEFQVRVMRAGKKANGQVGLGTWRALRKAYRAKRAAK